MFPKWSDWNLHYTRKGLVKKQAIRARNILLLVSIIVGAYWLRQGGSGSSPGIQSFNQFLQRYVKQGLLGISAVVNRGITMLSE